MNTFEQKLYNIIDEATIFFNDKGVANKKLLEEYVQRASVGLLRVAFERKEEIKEDIVSDKELLYMWNNQQMIDACREYARKYGCSLGEARRGMYRLAGKVPPEDK